MDLLAEIQALHSILAAHSQIEQAKGILMLSHGVTAPAAFDLLGRYADDHTISIRDLAAQLLGAVAQQPTANASSSAPADRAGSRHEEGDPSTVRPHSPPSS